MPGPFSSRISIILLSLSLATLPVLAQVAPPPPGYPQYPQNQYPPNQANVPPQGAADGGDQQEPGPGAGVARISLLDGDVSVRRGDSGDYVAGTQNAPVMAQDSIQTGNGARAEVQFDITSMIRLAQNTEVRFTDLQQGRSLMQLGRGTVTFRVLRDTNAQVEIDTPSVSVRPSRQGVYRITVTDDGQTYITPRAGQVEVFTPKGSQTVQVGQTMMARGPAADPEYQFVAALNRDEWDAWSDSRDRVFQQAWANTSQYVPPDVYGTEELNGHGQWVNTPDYGNVWEPAVGPDWAPYSVGRWAWEDYYGWTWISYDPWGWAPYHYGRWFWRGGLGWLWWPGALHARAFWSPALVGFFGFGHGFGVGFGGFGRIGWVALAPNERFHPWYGPGGFRNGVVVQNTVIANTYRNARVNNGVVAMNSQQFGRTSTGYTRVAQADLRSASVLHGSVPVTPSNQSLHFTDRQTNTFSRTNFSQTRFATHMTPASVQRTSFATQQQNLQRNFGPASSGNTFNRMGQTNTGQGASGSWNRYNNAPQNQSAIQGARAFGSTPGTRSIPQSPASGPGGGWNRFGSSSNVPPSGGSAYRGSSYGQGYGSSGGRSQLQISPPLVRERGNSNAAGSNAPRYSAPSYQAPHYSAPSYSAPHYSAPAQRSAPSGGGGHPSGGGGGGHSSSSGGGSHHR